MSDSSAQWVTVPELAARVHKTTKTIYRWGEAEGMPYHQPAGPKSSWFIDLAEFDTWLRNRCFARATRASVSS